MSYFDYLRYVSRGECLKQKKMTIVARNLGDLPCLQWTIFRRWLEEAFCSSKTIVFVGNSNRVMLWKEDGMGDAVMSAYKAM